MFFETSVSAEIWITIVIESRTSIPTGWRSEYILSPYPSFWRSKWLKGRGIQLIRSSLDLRSYRLERSMFVCGSLSLFTRYLQRLIPVKLLAEWSAIYYHWYIYENYDFGGVSHCLVKVHSGCYTYRAHSRLLTCSFKTMYIGIMSDSCWTTFASHRAWSFHKACTNCSPYFLQGSSLNNQPSSSPVCCFMIDRFFGKDPWTTHRLPAWGTSGHMLNT